ncbi:MAG: FAD-dependent oxidoreductase [Candidatus Aenigmarchaeota archaeon]|nr:FAD-dependent oxidoreductase [Candidatus Aenigmarchaeota archaeon]
MDHEHIAYDIAIIGGGVVGFAGAMYAGRLGMKTLVLSEMTGGTIILTDVVENYPGFKRLTGQELADNIQEHAMDYGANLVEEKAIKIVKCSESCYSIFTESQSFHAKTILFATGAKHRELGIPGEKEFANKGVHSCALCDGPIYKEKTVAVVGGSDSAAKEALVLAKWAKKVYIVYRGEKIRAEPVNMRRVEQKISEGKIEIINNTNVNEIHGAGRVEYVILDREYSGSKKFMIDAVFVEIGMIPNSQLAQSLGIATNSKMEIVINRKAEANLPGIFAAGDVADMEFKQAITGVGEAVAAVYSAYRYVNENEFICACNDEEFEKSIIQYGKGK